MNLPLAKMERLQVGQISEGNSQDFKSRDTNSETSIEKLIGWVSHLYTLVFLAPFLFLRHDNI